MNRHSKAAAVLLALIMAVFALTGCNRGEADILTLYDSNGLKIERQGAETRIYDLEGGADYTFTSHRARVKGGNAANYVQNAQTTADTDTVTIQTVYGLIIVTEKATGTTLYIKGAR